MVLQPNTAVWYPFQQVKIYYRKAFCVNVPWQHGYYEELMQENR